MGRWGTVERSARDMAARSGESGRAPPRLCHQHGDSRGVWSYPQWWWGGVEQGQAAGTVRGRPVGQRHTGWWGIRRKFVEERVWKVGEREGAGARSWRASERFGELLRGGAQSGSQEALQAACVNRPGEGWRRQGSSGGLLRPSRERALAEIRLEGEQLKDLEESSITEHGILLIRLPHLRLS